jgi:hypothetical protein
MSAATNFYENRWIDFMFRGQSLGITGSTAGSGSGPSALFIGLYTTNPTDVGGGTEVSGGSYARVSVASTLANWAGTQGAGTTAISTGTGGTTSNNNNISFPAPTANWGVITGFGIFDAATGGNLIIQSPLQSNKTVNNGDAAPAFPPGSLVITVD